MVTKRFMTEYPFFDRNEEQSDLHHQLDAHQSVIGIYGRAGMGKTALMNKVLRETQLQQTHSGIVYLRTNSRPILTVETIFFQLATFLPETHPFHQTYKTAQISAKNKTRELHKALQGGHYIVCIDNLETHQDPDLHYVTDDGIRAFLETCLEVGGKSALSVVITSRYPLPFSDSRPLNFPTITEKNHHAIHLDEGLPIDDALAYMHSIDTSKVLPALNADLKVWWHKVRGVPRGLEVLIQYLYKQPSHDIEDLLNDTPLFEGHITMNLVEKVHRTLPNVLEQVLQAVMVIGQDCTQEELTHVLAPYIDTIHISMLLKDLVERRLLSHHELRKTYSLPTLDLVYLQKSLPVGTAEDIPKPDPVLAFYEKIGKTPPPEIANKRTITPFSQFALTHRIAEYYRQKRKPQVEWHNIDDILPQLREMEYRMALGDYDHATNILIDIGFDYLHKWGFTDLLLRLHTALEGKIKDPASALTIMMNLGMVYRQMDNPEISLQKYQVALEMAQAQANRTIEARVTGAIGIAYYEMGQFDIAKNYYLQAYEMCKTVGDKVGEGGWLGNVGNAYVRLGYHENAIEYYKQAYAVSKSIDDAPREIALLGNIGSVYGLIGKSEDAITYITQSLNLCIKTKNRRSEAICLGNLGDYHTLLRQYQNAVFYLQEAIKIFNELKTSQDMRILSQIQSHQQTLARAYWYMGDMNRALATIEESRLYHIPSNELRGLILNGAILFCLGKKDEAQKIFLEAIVVSDKQLVVTAEDYQVLYARSFSHAGLWVITGDKFHHEKALSRYQQSIAVAHGMGIRMREKMLLIALFACADGYDVAELIDLLEHE